MSESDLQAAMRLRTVLLKVGHVVLPRGMTDDIRQRSIEGDIHLPHGSTSRFRLTLDAPYMLHRRVAVPAFHHWHDRPHELLALYVMVDACEKCGRY